MTSRHQKPNKPMPDFPLFPHGNGSWAKKVRGRIHYFGPWHDPEGSLREFRRQFPDLAAKSSRSETTPAPAAKRTRKPKANGKPKRPRGCPLTAHANGQWAYSHRGKYFYFGEWSDLESALKLFEQQIGDIKAGREVTRTADGLPIRAACNHFMAAKEAQVATGELSKERYKFLHRTCRRVMAKFGESRTVESLAPADFAELRQELAKREKGDGMVSLETLKEYITRVRTLFNYLFEAKLIDKPVELGASFGKPTQQSLDRERARKTPKQFTANEINVVLDVTKPTMRAMILLGVNCGFGNEDCADLCFDHLDLQAGWVRLPRSKTGQERSCPLWPETVKAIQAAIKVRPNPKPGNEQRVFLTRCGNAWTNAGDRATALVKEFRETLQAVNHYKMGRGFYSLRHTFYQIALGVGDPFAAKSLMGHKPQDIVSTYYAPKVHPDRLIRITEHVREWLFKSGPEVRSNL